MDDTRSLNDIKTTAEGDFGPLVKVRKFVIHVEDVLHEFGPPASRPQRKGYIAAVTHNPYAGRYVEDLSELMDIGEEMGEFLGKMCIDALGIEGGKAHSFGKAAIVGENGEWEHAAAVLHPKLGAPLRKLLVKGPSLIPSVKKLGGPGATIDVPLNHKDAAYVRSHYDGIEVGLPDAPRANEILVAIAVTGSVTVLPALMSLLGVFTLAAYDQELGLSKGVLRVAVVVVPLALGMGSAYLARRLAPRREARDLPARPPERAVSQVRS